MNATQMSMVTHPSMNQAQHTPTALIKTNVLQLCQTTTGTFLVHRSNYGWMHLLMPLTARMGDSGN